MRSLNVGIAGLALLGGAALLPQSAMATASYLMDVTLDSSASTTSGGATISYENFFDGIQRVGGSYGTSGNATYDFSTKTELPPVGVPSSQISSSTIAVRQTGSASGIDGGGTSVTREGFSSDFSTEDLDVLTNDNTLGTLITVSDVAAGTSLDISVNFFALLSGAVAFPADEEWRAYSSWTIQMSTRDADSEDPADWSDFTTEFGSLAGQIAGGATPQIISTETASYSYDTDTMFTLLLSEDLEYRFRISMLNRARALSSAVPVPAALPLLGAAIAGLGLVARRRKAA